MTKSKEIPVDEYRATEGEVNSRQYTEATRRGEEMSVAMRKYPLVAN
jgi:hypothetical protein